MSCCLALNLLLLLQILPPCVLGGGENVSCENKELLHLSFDGRQFSQEMECFGSLQTQIFLTQGLQGLLGSDTYYPSAYLYLLHCFSASFISFFLYHSFFFSPLLLCPLVCFLCVHVCAYMHACMCMFICVCLNPSILLCFALIFFLSLSSPSLNLWSLFKYLLFLQSFFLSYLDPHLALSPHIVTPQSLISLEI